MSAQPALDLMRPCCRTCGREMPEEARFGPGAENWWCENLHLDEPRRVTHEYYCNEHRTSPGPLPRGGVVRACHAGDES